MKLRTVLIVDDQAINRAILKKLLSGSYLTLEARDGREALTVLHAHANDIAAVLLDIVMPVMNGYEVLEQMAQDSGLSKIPVIVSSRNDDADSEIHALALGAQDFVSKPFKPEIILHRLHNIIRLRETAAMVNKARRDELTGLYNKAYFLENAAEYLTQHPDGQYDLICLSVEQFRLVNEIFGMKKGDELLRYIGGLLSEIPELILTSRFSADLFYLLVPHRERYDEAFLSPYLGKLSGFPLDMDIRPYFGVYVISDRQLSVGAMCDRAKLAAQSSKSVYDRACSYYDEALQQKQQQEQFVLANMRTALLERQFQVYYQPKYDLNNELMAGAEALVRWIHPTKGFLPPSAFIPLFENNGYITHLDEYVWETVCRDIRGWMDQGYTPVTISANVSRADLYNPRLPDILLGLLDKYKVPIRYFHLEISESAYTNNPRQIVQVVKNLRELGFSIEMDDFGSGYSSLNMLAEMPVDILKLDMGFIQNEAGSGNGKGILNFVISLAKWLDLAVIAEGVETADQIAALRSMDCNYVQGFYYARPMKKEDFDVLLRTAKVTEMVCTSQAVRLSALPAPAPSSTSDLPLMLIIDDIEFNRTVLSSAFSGEYRIVEKENGSTAWDYLEAHYAEVRMILLDLLMPVVDGFQLLNKIRFDVRTRDIPVIITSQGDTKSEQRALEMQADDFVSKPYNTVVIRHRVRNVQESSRLRQLERQHRIAQMPLPSIERSQDESLTPEEKTLLAVDALMPYFDIVRLVDARHTLVHEPGCAGCSAHSCFSIWGKTARCSNCTSLQALQKKNRCSKLEYDGKNLYYVISAYVPYGESGAVLEMVTRLDDQYVDSILDRGMLYVSLDTINHQQDRDPLTGAFSRRYLNVRLEHYVTSARSRQTDLGAAMVDIRHFRQFNDTLGHLISDEILRSVVKLLQCNVAQSKGDFVARYDNDRFLLVCRDIAPDVFARRIKAITGLMHHITVSQQVSVSVEVVVGSVNLSELSGGTGRDLIHEADRRLLLAKATLDAVPQ